MAFPQIQHSTACSDRYWADRKAARALQDFSEWAQCQVLEAVSSYRPASEQEVFDIMNVLDDRLLHSNSAVVMATVKLFLHLTLAMPPTHQQVAPLPPLSRCRRMPPCLLRSAVPRPSKAAALHCLSSMPGSWLHARVESPHCCRRSLAQTCTGTA